MLDAPALNTHRAPPLRDFTPRHKLEQALQDIRDQALENDEPWFAAKVDEVLARKPQ